MKTVRITRVAGSSEYGVFGTLVLNGQPICLTLEPYSKDNASNLSCINAGQYLMKRYESPKYGDIWMIQEVQGRSYIELHWGNFLRDTKGCIILGEEFSVLSGKWALKSSKKAFEEFMKLTKDEDTLLLTIIDAY